MAKALKTAAVIVGAATLIATGVGAVGGAGIIAGSVATTIGTITGIAATGLTTLSALADKRPGTEPVGGNQENFTANKNQGIPYGVGRTQVSGWLIHRQTFDVAAFNTKDNAFQSLFAVWGGGGPYHKLEAFKVDGVTVDFGVDPVAASAPAEAVGTFHGNMFLQAQLGRTPELIALKALDINPYPSGWSAQSKLSGYAAFSWLLRWDPQGKKFPTGVPQPAAVLEGALVYDPRQDSTFPGGSGPCRAGDESTYVWEGIDVAKPAGKNPWLHALTWALGRWQNDKRILGIGMTLGAIDVAAYAHAANVADANDWTIGGVVYSTDGKLDVLKKMCAAGGGAPLQLGGTLSCEVDAPRVSLATITDDQIIGDASVIATPTISERINGVIPSCRLEDHDWSIVPCDKVQIGAYVADDGREKTKAITWELVQDADQVAELATYAICNAREFGPIVTPLKLRWIGYRPGDCLTITSSNLGMAAQTVVVRNRHLDPSSGAVTLMMRSETTEKHAFSLGQTTTPPPTPGLQVIDPATLPVPGIDASYGDGTPIEVLRPADPSATRGAPAGTPVGDRLAEEINQAIDDLRTAVENGDAGSSAEAIQAAQNAAAARDAAQGARNEAQGFRDQAQGLVDNFDPSLDPAQLQTVVEEVKASSVVRPNILRYGSFEAGATGWTGLGGSTGMVPYNHSQLGPIVYGVPSTPASGAISSDPFPIEAGAQVTISGDVQIDADGGYVYLDMLFFNAGGMVLLDGDQNAIPHGAYFNNTTGANQQATAKTYSAPPGTATARARFVWVDLTGLRGIGARRIKVESGPKWSWYTDDATAIEFNARIVTTETAVTDGRFVAATRFAQLEAQTIGTGATSLSSRITDNAIAATTATGAIADRASTLEARGRSSLTLNSDYNSWPDGAPLPTGWGNWSNAHLITRTPGVANTGSRWSALMNAPADTNVGLQQGFFKPFGSFEMSVTVEASEYRGSGMLVQWFTYNNGNLIYRNSSQISFATDKDTSGWVGTGGYRRTFVKQFTTDIDGNIDYFIIYAMGNWDYFGQPRVAKSIRFIECALSPASAGALTAKDAVARISTEETVRANADGALSARQDITEAKFNGTQSSWVSEQITAQASATGAVADRATKLEATTRVNPNLVRNSSFENGSKGWTGTVGLFDFYTNPAWGPVAYSKGRITAADAYLDCEPVQIYGDNFYTASASVEMFPEGTSNTQNTKAYIGIVWLNAAGQYINEVRGAYRGGPTSFATNTLDEMKVTGKSPPNAVFALARFGTNPIQDTAVGFRRMKLEFGAERTLYSTEGTLLSFNARISTTESAVTDGRFASASRASTLEAQMNGTQDSNLRARIVTVESATTDGRFASASRATDLEAQMNGTQDSNLRSRIKTLETVTSDGTFATAGRVDTLEVSIPKTGNLLDNSPLITVDGWTLASQGLSGLTSGLNIAGDDWHPAGENVLSIYQAGGNGGQSCYWYSTLVSVIPGQVYQAQFLANTHRCKAEVMVEHWDSTSALNANPISAGGQFQPGGQIGRNVSSFTQASLNFTARGNYARLRIVKWGTIAGTDSYLWAFRPQIAQIKAMTSPLAAYLPSSDRATATKSLARLQTVEGVTADINGRTQAFWSKTATAGGGRAAISLFAIDDNGHVQAGVNITGDLRIEGGQVYIDGQVLGTGTTSGAALNASTLISYGGGDDVNGFYQCYGMGQVLEINDFHIALPAIYTNGVGTGVVEVDILAARATFVVANANWNSAGDSYVQFFVQLPNGGRAYGVGLGGYGVNLPLSGLTKINIPANNGDGAAWVGLRLVHGSTYRADDQIMSPDIELGKMFAEATWKRI